MAGKRKFESSGGAHPAGIPMSSTDRKSTSGEASSGSEHSAETFTFVFGDSASIPLDLQRHLVGDSRPNYNPNDVHEFAQELDADLEIRVDTIDIEQNTHWHIRLQKPWTNSAPEIVYLTERWHVVRSTVRRSTPCAEEHHLVLVNTLKGKASAPADLQFSLTERKANVFALFTLLLESEDSTIVVGNFGFALSSIFRFGEEYKQETGVDVTNRFELIASDDQQLLCFHTKEKGQRCLRIDAAAPDKILVVQIRSNERLAKDTDASPHGGECLAEEADSSGGEHPAGSESLPVSETRAHTLMVLLSEASEQLNVNLLENILLQPVVEYRHPYRDGIGVTGPIDMEGTLALLTYTLDLANNARFSAGVRNPNQTLSSHEFEVAYHWLQHECFEKYFLCNERIIREVQELDDAPETINRKEKKRIRNDRRGAFKTWQHALMGNIHLFRAMMRHGLFEFADLQDFMVAYTQILEEEKQRRSTNAAASVDTMLSEDIEKKRQLQLREDALAARRRLKHARKLAMSQQQLSIAELDLLEKLNSGELDRLCLERNRAYGHGDGTKSIARDDATLFRVSCNLLDKYFQRSSDAETSCG
jgi:hypothetical protein